jgi:cbb3-type cytochrome oxidase subunit 3
MNSLLFLIIVLILFICFLAIVYRSKANRKFNGSSRLNYNPDIIHYGYKPMSEIDSCDEQFGAIIYNCMLLYVKGWNCNLTYILDPGAANGPTYGDVVRYVFNPVADKKRNKFTYILRSNPLVAFDPALDDLQNPTTIHDLEGGKVMDSLKKFVTQHVYLITNEKEEYQLGLTWNSHVVIPFKTLFPDNFIYFTCPGHITFGVENNESYQDYHRYKCIMSDTRTILQYLNIESDYISDRGDSNSPSDYGITWDKNKAYIVNMNGTLEKPIHNPIITMRSKLGILHNNYGKSSNVKIINYYTNKDLIPELSLEKYKIVNNTFYNHIVDPIISDLVGSQDGIYLYSTFYGSTDDYLHHNKIYRYKLNTNRLELLLQGIYDFHNMSFPASADSDPLLYLSHLTVETATGTERIINPAATLRVNQNPHVTPTKTVWNILSPPIVIPPAPVPAPLGWEMDNDDEPFEKL